MTVAAAAERTQQPDGREPPRGLWAGLERAASPDTGAGGLYRGLARRIAASALQTDARPLWKALADRCDRAQYRPRAVPDVAEERVTEGEQAFTVIRSPRGNYLRLTPEQRELWHRMDGSRSVAQLATEGFLEFKRLLPVGELVAALRGEGFLVDQPVGVYRSLGSSLVERTPEGWGRRVLRFLTGATWQLRSIDGFYDAIHRAAGWAFFTPVFVGIWALVALAGLAAFVLLLLDPGRRQLFAAEAPLPLEIAALWLGIGISLFLHESAHALAVKHYGRTLRGGGAMLYFGAPAFFVDTSDIWRSPRRARIVVSAAGPMSDLFLGGLAALLVLFVPEMVGAGIAYKLAIICYVATLFNLNPLLELDGYYILVDVLRMPDLRRRSLEFVRGPLWSKIGVGGRATPSPAPSHALLTREERIFTLYGVLALLYTVLAVGFAWQFWNRQLLGTIERLWASDSPPHRAVAAALFLLVVVPVVAGLAFAALGAGRAALGWIIRRGYGRQPALLFALALVAAGGLALVAGRYGEAVGLPMTLALWGVAWGGLRALRPDYKGAAIAPALDALLAATILAAIGSLVQTLAPRSPIWIAADGAAFVFVLAAGFAVLLDVNLRAAPIRDLAVTAALLMLAFAAGSVALLDIGRVWAGWPAGLQIAAAAPAYFGAVAAALLLPFLLQLRDSRLFWSWALLWLATIAETAGYLLDLRRIAGGSESVVWLDVLAAGLWAGAWLVHVATLRQVTTDEISWSPTSSVSEGERLARAFQLTYAGCYHLLRTVYGSRRTRELDDRMDIYAATADWDVTLDRDQARIGMAAAALPLDAQGKRYAEVLRYTVQTVEELSGAAFARRAVQAAYDALPWPERETASRLCFPDTPWAHALSRGFGDVRTARLRLLRQVDQFLHCDDEELEALAHVLQEQKAAAGAAVLPAGGRPLGMYIVEAGEIIAESGTQAEVELHRGDAFGALELEEDKPAGLTYRASVPSSLLLIPAAELRALAAARAPHVAEGEEAAASLRMLERVPLLSNLPRATLRQLAHSAARERFVARSVVVSQGQPIETLYVIKQGRAAVVARDEGGGVPRARLVTRLADGELFGEMELLRGGPAAASVVAVTEMAVLALPYADVRSLILGADGLARQLEQLGTGRVLASQG